MINHEFTITGASTIFFQLACHLQDRGHRITVAPSIPADGPMKARYERRGIPIVTKIDLSAFDLAIANTVATAGYVLHLGPRLRTIWYIHEAEIGLKVLLEHQEWLSAFDGAAAIVYNMPFQQDVYRSFTYALDQGKFHTLPFGVEIDRAAIARDAVPAKRRALRILQVGSLEPRKRPGDVILAVARSGLDAECILCGQHFHLDDSAKAIIARAPERFRIIEGATDDEIHAWQELADIVCLASGSETQGLAAYEAALLARPLLLSDLPCYRDVFVHGRNCLMFPVGHIDMLAMSMAMLAANPALRTHLGLAAQRTVMRFSREAFFARFEGVMVTAVAGAVIAERAAP